ncbi:hypothetical protein NQ314_020293, partial [Rhamnusium bicolor]
FHLTFSIFRMRNFSASALICDNYLYTRGNKTTELDAIDHIINVAPQLEKALFICIWTLTLENCTSVFTKILTEDGLCFTSNMLGRSQLLRNKVYLHDYTEHGINIEGWSLEDGYPKTAKKDTFPRRAMSSGFTGSHILVLADYEDDLDYVCKSQLQGFKVILHHPAEIPRVSMKYYQAPLNQELLITIIPEMMTTSGSLKSYDPHKRECFFLDERYLSFFQTYTQQNCQFECLTNYTLKKCGCVAFYMPLEMMERDVNLGISEFKNQDSEVDGHECDCLPACTSLIYNAEFSQSDYNFQKVFEGFGTNMSEFPGTKAVCHPTKLNPVIIFILEAVLLEKTGYEEECDAYEDSCLSVDDDLSITFTDSDDQTTDDEHNEHELEKEDEKKVEECTSEEQFEGESE